MPFNLLVNCIYRYLGPWFLIIISSRGTSTIDLDLRTEAVVKFFLPPFGCDLVRPPYVFIDSKLFSITLSFYFRAICFWRFNSIIMTWNKWKGFTNSVIMGWNNISPWPCPLGLVCLPCVIIRLYSTPLLFMRVVGLVVCLSLGMANFAGSRRTQYSVVTVIFYCWHCFVLYALFFTQWLIYQFSFHVDILI